MSTYQAQESAWCSPLSWIPREVDTGMNVGNQETTEESSAMTIRCSRFRVVCLWHPHSSSVTMIWNPNPRCIRRFHTERHYAYAESNQLLILCFRRSCEHVRECLHTLQKKIKNNRYILPTNFTPAESPIVPTWTLSCPTLSLTILKTGEKASTPLPVLQQLTLSYSYERVTRHTSHLCTAHGYRYRATARHVQ